MIDFPAIADRVEIEALRGEVTDAVMMRRRIRTALVQRSSPNSTSFAAVSVRRW
jgi:hypothetical protein